MDGISTSFTCEQDIWEQCKGERLVREQRGERQFRGRETPAAFVLQDSEHRQIDVHTMWIDALGNGNPAWKNEERLIFEKEGLMGYGSVAGVQGHCITPPMRVVCRTGNDLEFRMRDMRLLQLPAPLAE